MIISELNPLFISFKEYATMDSTDKAILKLLQEDATLSLDLQYVLVPLKRLFGIE